MYLICMQEDCNVLDGNDVHGFPLRPENLV